MSANSHVQYSNPEGHPPFSPIYSHISSVPISAEATLVSIAGQIGYDAVNNVTPSTLAEQVKVALNNVDKCLAHAGVTKGDIIQVRQYVVDLLPLDPKRAEIYTAWLGDLRPPSTNLGVQSLVRKELLYEIEVVCLKREGSA